MRLAYIRRYLMVKGRFAELILSGKKTTTIRLGKVVPKCNEIIIHSSGKPIAEARIKNVVYKKVRELTEDDAKRDGYPSLQELLNDLKKMYGREVGPEDTVTIIEFEVTKRFSDIDADDVYLGLSPYTIALLANRYLRGELTEEEKTVVEYMLRYRSIRVTSIKLYKTLQKRWAVRRALRRILAKLVDRGVIEVSEEVLKKLASVSKFWERYLTAKEGLGPGVAWGGGNGYAGKGGGEEGKKKEGEEVS